MFQTTINTIYTISLRVGTSAHRAHAFCTHFPICWRRRERMGFIRRTKRTMWMGKPSLHPKKRGRRIAHSYLSSLFSLMTLLAMSALTATSCVVDSNLRRIFANSDRSRRASRRFTLRTRVIWRTINECVTDRPTDWPTKKVLKSPFSHQAWTNAIQYLVQIKRSGNTKKVIKSLGVVPSMSIIRYQFYWPG